MRLSSNQLFLYLLCGVIFSLPFIFWPQTHLYEAPKFYFLIIPSQVLALILAFSKSKFHLDKLVLLVFVFLGILFLANVLGVDPKTSFFGSASRYQGFLTMWSAVILFLSARHFATEEKNVFFIVKTLIVAQICLSLLGLIQFFLLKTIGGEVVNYQGRVAATFGNPNFFGGVEACLLPFLLFSPKYFLFTPKYFARKEVIFRFLKKWPIKWSLVGLIIFSILLSGSRSAILATLVVGGVYLISTLPQLSRKKSVGLVFFGIICLIFAAYFVHGSGLTERRVSCCDNRTIVWQQATRAVRDRPILGWGQENFQLVEVEKQILADNTHNIFLEMLVSAGWAGLILFLLIILTALGKASLPIKLSLVALLITAQFNPISVYQIVLLWVLVGLAYFKPKIAPQNFLVTLALLGGVVATALVIGFETYSFLHYSSVRYEIVSFGLDNPTAFYSIKKDGDDYLVTYHYEVDGGVFDKSGKVGKSDTQLAPLVGKNVWITGKWSEDWIRTQCVATVCHPIDKTYTIDIWGIRER